MLNVRYCLEFNLKVLLFIPAYQPRQLLPNNKNIFLTNLMTY